MLRNRDDTDMGTVGFKRGERGKRWRFLNGNDYYLTQAAASIGATVIVDTTKWSLLEQYRRRTRVSRDGLPTLNKLRLPSWAPAGEETQIRSRRGTQRRRLPRVASAKAWPRHGATEVAVAMMDALRYRPDPRRAGDPGTTPPGAPVRGGPGGYPKTVAIEHDRPSELQMAIERAGGRAQSSRELRPIITGSFARPVTSELAAFVDRILTDGTYVRAVAHLVADDPELADT